MALAGCGHASTRPVLAKAAGVVTNVFEVFPTNVRPERHGPGVVRPHFEPQLGDASFAETPLELAHELAAKTGPPLARVNNAAFDSSSVAVIGTHHRRDENTVDLGDEEQVAVVAEFRCDFVAINGFIVIDTSLSPQNKDRVDVSRTGGAKGDFRTHERWVRT